MEDKLEDVSRCLCPASMDFVKAGHFNLTIDFSVVLRPSVNRKECPTVVPLPVHCKPNKFRAQVSPARALATWLFHTFPHSRQNRYNSDCAEPQRACALGLHSTASSRESQITSRGPQFTSRGVLLFARLDYNGGAMWWRFYACRSSGSFLGWREIGLAGSH